MSAVTTMEPMTPDHVRWDEFLDRLEGPEGIDAHERIPGDEMSIVWTCGGFSDKTAAERILKSMGLSRSAIAESFECFDEEGGHCDCEILTNVDDDLEPDAD